VHNCADCCEKPLAAQQETMPASRLSTLSPGKRRTFRSAVDNFVNKKVQTYLLGITAAPKSRLARMAVSVKAKEINDLLHISGSCTFPQVKLLPFRNM
jgi:hypothetical protein